MEDQSDSDQWATPGAASLVPVPAPGAGLASPEEIAAFQARFVRLLERRTAIYTMGDSSSVPKHVAADLLRSICFVLGIDPDDPEITQELLSVDLEDEYRRRLAEIGREVDSAKQLWHEVDATMPLIENIALRDTLHNLGDFFKWYDYRSMAHEIPCSIDYPLCHPVPESLQGIQYITEYVRRLLIEAQFLQRFDIAAIERVLAKASPDHIELLVNFYEPVATNAIGLALIGKDPTALAISDDDRMQIERRLQPLGQAARERVLRDVAARMCEQLGVFEDPTASAYLTDLVPELLPRIAVGLAHGNVRGVLWGEPRTRVAPCSVTWW